MNQDPIFIRINSLLEARKVMQKDLISAIGMSKGTYTQWKLGTCASYKSHLPEISKFFNVSISYLADGIDKEIATDTVVEVLTNHEMKIMQMFRKTKPETQKSIFDLLNSIVS